MADLHKILALASLVDRLDEHLFECAMKPQGVDEALWNEAWSELRAASERLVRCLAYNDMLLGTEYCDECGRVVGVVTRIERKPDLMIVISSGDAVYPSDV